MSLKQVAGGPSPAAVAETRANAKAAAGVSGKYAVVDGTDQAANEFPYVPFAPDSYDDTAQIKNTFSNAAAVGGNWVVPFTEQDAAYVKRQRDQVENADFDRWVMQKFNLNNPAELFLFQSIAPEQFQRRLDLIDYEQNLVSKYAKMRCMGPRSLEDLKFEWLIETGRVELPAGPIWDPVKWMGAQMGQPVVPQNERAWARRGEPNRARFMAGLFSPLGYLTEGQVGWKASDNKADIRGDPTTRTMGQVYKGSTTADSLVYARYGANPIRNTDISAYDPAEPGELFGSAIPAARRVRAGAAGAVGAAIPRRRGYGADPYGIIP